MQFDNNKMDALTQSTRVHFHSRVLKFLRSELPQQTAHIADGALLKRIDDGERRAAAYGIESETGIAQFICLTFAAGPEFDAIPEIRAYLIAPEVHLSAEDRLDELVDRLFGDLAD